MVSGDTVPTEAAEAVEVQLVVVVAGSLAGGPPLLGLTSSRIKSVNIQLVDSSQFCSIVLRFC